MDEKHVISILVSNRPGALSRISGLFSRRGYNIDSLSVCATEDDGYSRMTITVKGTDRAIVQIMSQLDKQIDVAKVVTLDDKSVFRELLIAKISVTPEKRGEIVDLCTIFKAKTIDISPDDTMILELTGESDKIDAFINVLMPYGLLEMARTGGAALFRGKNCIKD